MSRCSVVPVVCVAVCLWCVCFGWHSVASGYLLRWLRWVWFSPWFGAIIVEFLAVFRRGVVLLLLALVGLGGFYCGF